MKTGIEKWHELDGDKTLALDWPLNEDSHVWEIGGFEGRWAQQIWDRFHCNITIFEPQMWAVEKMRKRFEGIGKIEIRPYGLWVEDCIKPIYNFFTDGATIIHRSHHYEPTDAALGSFHDFNQETMGLSYKVDVGLMNIEGAEFTLLPLFIVSGAIQVFDVFWCQFHPNSTSDLDESEIIFEKMKETHKLLWSCFPTAVAWRKR